MNAPQVDWLTIRRLLWDDSEYVLFANRTDQPKPFRRVRDVSEQPKQPYCTPNGFSGYDANRDNAHVTRYHTFVIEHDDMPLDAQREMWRQSDMPHTLRVFSGNKSVHVVIRCEGHISCKQWISTAKALKTVFPNACKQALMGRSRVCRTPGGTRKDGTLQAVEYVGARVPFHQLNSWIERQGVTKSTKSTKAQRYQEESLPLPSPTSAEMRGRIERAATEAAAQTAYSASTPERARLYGILVERRFIPERHQRNHVLTAQMIPFLFGAVCRDLAMEFAGCFHRFNASLFRDSIEAHMNEAGHAWDAVAESYPQRLSDTERTLYEALAPKERDVFRIARSFALDVKEKAYGPREFYMPLHKTGIRLGLPPRRGTDVDRVVKRFIRLGAVKVVKLGKSSRPLPGGGVAKGEGTIYRWLL